ncbi:hypothetical protein BH10ACT1_BH10ACT1_11980 [soil metagenome]
MNHRRLYDLMSQQRQSLLEAACLPGVTSTEIARRTGLSVALINVELRSALHHLQAHG